MNHLTLDRIHHLCDPGSFEPLGPLSGAGYILGSGQVGGRPVHMLAADIDSPLTMPVLDAFARVADFIAAVREQPAPLVQLLDVQASFRADSDKTLIPPGGLELLAHERGMGRIYSGLGQLEGLVPRIAVILGPTSASRSFPAALCDATVMLRSAALCLGRPDAVRRMTGHETSFDKLGGPDVQAVASGTVHKVVDTERGALAWTRAWLGYLPMHADAEPPVGEPRPPRHAIAEVQAEFARELNTAVEMHRLIDAVVDGGSWFELGELHAGECLTGLARFQGVAAGILANNAAVRGGILHPESCRKMTRFIRFCSAFRLPLVFLVDTPGFMVGEEVERRGNVQAAADLYTAIAKSPSPRVCVVVRKAYSAGLYAMAGAGFDARFWALPSASISIMGPEALRRFRAGQQGADGCCPEAAIDDMLAAATCPDSLVAKGLIDAVLGWDALRAKLGDFLAQSRDHSSQDS